MTELYTIGHSTRSLEEFIELLKRYKIQILVDVRTWPSSRHYPHFNRENLTQNLQQHGIRYEWLGEQLGGYRKNGLGEESPNKGWENQSFRNYADYTVTEQFKEGIRRLSELAEGGRVALMCAEQLYWRCHRRIIADYLTLKDYAVTYIVEKKKAEKHKLTDFVKAINGELQYPSPQTTLLARR